MMLVVAVALVAPDGQVLMQRRALHRAHGGLWEFPGGKIEPNETAHAAAIREISEELGVEITAPALIPLSFAADPLAAADAPLILLYACRAWHGEPRCMEDEAIGWFAPAEMAALAMPPLDVPLALALGDWLARQISAK